MTMLKTTTANTPAKYIAAIKDPSRRAEIEKIHKVIRTSVPQLKPHIQSGMLGYGTYHYKYASGREGDWPVIALASQKNYISVYICATVDGRYLPEKYGQALGKVSVGKSCIRFKTLSDLNLPVLEKALREGSKPPVGKK